MLARITKYNKKAEEIMNEGREHLHKKVMCKMGEGMRMITRCDKLWRMKIRNEEDEKEMEDVIKRSRKRHWKTEGNSMKETLTWL
jgi:hypothetical protein